MFYGKIDDTLQQLLDEYESIFGYDVSGEMGIEIGDYELYKLILTECVKTKKDIFDVMFGEDVE